MPRPPPMVTNSLTRRPSPLWPVTHPPTTPLTLYVCGPTVYDRAHLGHARTYILFDTIQRCVQRLWDREMILVVNVTDVDDKILARAKERGETRAQVAEACEKLFWEEMSKLGVRRPTCVPHATDFIPEMLAMIGDLVQRGVAYRTADGSVYMDTHEVNRVLSTIPPSSPFQQPCLHGGGYPGTMCPGRVLHSSSSPDGSNNTSTTNKRSMDDFALWKASSTGTDADSDSWDAEPVAGRGRPGWHIECSAMVHHTVGRVTHSPEPGRCDVHGGGVDLCFPHHANERAQSEVLLRLQGGPEQQDEWTRVFLHSGHVVTGKTGEKMSKSLGNFVTVEDALKHMTPRQLRLLFLSSSRFAANLEWNDKSVEVAQALDRTLRNFFTMCRERDQRPPPLQDRVTEEDAKLMRDVATARVDVMARLSDDFDFAGVIAVLHGLVRAASRRATASGEPGLPCSVRVVRQYVSDVFDVLGFGGRVGGGVSAFDEDEPRLPPRGPNDATVPALLDVLTSFRARVRGVAVQQQQQEQRDPVEVRRTLLDACDQVRVTLRDKLHVDVKDGKDGSSTWSSRHSTA